MVLGKDDNAVSEKLLLRAKTICNMINLALRVVFVVFCISWLFASCSMIRALSDSSAINHAGFPSAFQITLHFLYGVTVSVLFLVFTGVFSDVAKGKTPFAPIQVKRLRVISAMLVAYAFLDFLISANNSIIERGGFSSGFITASDNAIIPINFAPFIAALVAFAFSFVFQYGVLLQEFSDETL